MDKSTPLKFLLSFLFLFSSFCSMGNPNAPDRPEAQDSIPRNGVFSGRIRTDSVFYHNQLSFISRDSALFFLDGSASSLSEIPCAVFYRVAPLNKYYQETGHVTDYYLDNDSIAARLSYDNGVLDGPCTFYYRNGKIREKGIYTKNLRKGIWEYYYDNGGKSKTVRFTDSGVYLMDCFKENGEMLAQNGNGRFEGTVLSGTPYSTIELNESGPIKDGVPDGEWKLYSNLLPNPLFVEQFSAGRFIHGVSNPKKTGAKEYEQRSFSTVEGVHPIEVLNTIQITISVLWLEKI